MNSSWIKAALKYALLLMPAALLVGVISIVIAGFWVSAIFADTARFAAAPRLIQSIARSVYQNVRTHWQIKAECIQFDAELLYRPRSGVCRFSNFEFDTAMHFNAKGFRRTSTPIDAPLGRGRIIIVGDSHAMGWGVEDHETFASQLAVEFGFSTLNLGVSSYGTARELKFLNRAIQLAADDVVIIQYCDNDLSENEHFAAHGRVGPYQPSDLDPLLKYRPTRAKPIPIAGQILRRTIQAVRGKLRAYLGEMTEQSSEQPDPAHAAKMLLSVIRGLGITRDQTVIVVAINGPDHSSHLESGRDLLESAGIALVEPQLTKDHFLQIDEHMKPNGHLAVASAIAKHLTANATIRPTTNSQ